MTNCTHFHRPKSILFHVMVKTVRNEVMFESFGINKIFSRKYVILTIWAAVSSILAKELLVTF